MKRFNIKLYILLGVIVVFTSCGSNNGDYKKEDRKGNTIAIEKEHDDVVKSNESVDENVQGERENTPIKRNKIFITENKIQYNRKAIELNDDAMSSITYSMPPLTSKDTSLLRKAIVLFNKAISIDSLYYLAYANKAMVLKHLGQNNEAIHVLSVITKLKPDYAEGFSMLGFTYEKLGNMDSAIIKYKAAIIAYSHRIELTNDVSDKVNRAFILSLIDKEKGLQEMDYLIEENPDDNTINFWKQQLFEGFDRQKYISKQ
jgi:tetratricopeptide (TPR) repeat protein